MVGNLANMILVKIADPTEFYNSFGMMCAKHAAELSNKIAEEKGFNIQEVGKAAQLAMLYDGGTVKVENLIQQF